MANTVSDDEIMLVARAMIRDYGSAAAAEAHRRAASFKGAGDGLGADVWGRIDAYIETLTCAAPNRAGEATSCIDRTDDGPEHT